MAMSLRTYLNNQIKAKGSSLAKEKAKAGKYKSIAAAKKAGALYYTNKDGKVMAAVYADDLKKSKPIPRPKLRPNKEKLGAGERPKVTTKTLPDAKKPESKLVKMAIVAIGKGTEPTGKAARIAKLRAEMRRLKKIITAGKNKKPPVVKRREQARIREIEGILKRMK